MKKITVTLLIITAMLSAQPEFFGMGRPMDNQKMENYRIYQMTEYLSLTPEQAAIFFPMQKTFLDSQKALYERYKNIRDQWFEANKDQVSEAASRQLLAKWTEFESERIRQRESFVKSLFGILDAEQIARYMFFEEHFRKHLRHELEQRKDNRQQRRMK
jgi:ribosomal protein S17E